MELINMPDQFSELNIKSRLIVPGTFRSTKQQAYRNEITRNSVNDYTRAGRQVTLSEGHPWPPPKRGNHGDIGGAFRTSRTYFTDSLGGRPKSLSEFPYYETRSTPDWPSRSIGLREDGPAFPMNPPVHNDQKDWPPDGASTEDELMVLGSTAIARCKPTNSVADLSVTLAELVREGLPSIPGLSTWQDRTNLSRGAGSEYLNTVFGWQPLVSEVQGVSKAIKTAEETWAQYKRDAGRVVRRSYRWPVDRSSEVISEETQRTPFPTRTASVMSSWNGTRRVTRHTETRRWFDGAFSYTLPESDGVVGSFLSKAAYARKILGVSLDPEVLWNLSPWSWAVDWFVNAGDVISNLSDWATDGLVMRYGYMMEHVTVTDVYQLSGLGPKYGRFPETCTLCLVTETKSRVRASPYGFGVTWESFTPRQLAIVAALGITRT